MTDPRAQARQGFLSHTAWAGSDVQPLAADASFRQYFRVFDFQKGTQAVLMDAPPDKEKMTAQFCDIARTLRTHGLSAPEIYAEDLGAGFVLLEDLGDGSYTKVLNAAPERTQELYTAAHDVVLALQGISMPSIPPYDVPALARELDVFCDHWWPHAFSQSMPTDIRIAFDAAWAPLLARAQDAAAARPALTLRDFHVDNMFDLPARTGAARVGLLDFQDALMGHAAYDLVSLLQDARRDVPGDLEHQLLTSATKHLCDPDLPEIYAILGAQRALKILGVFVRLETLYGKTGYSQHLPRTWQRVMQNMHHPALANVAVWLQTHIPLERRESHA